MRNILKKLLGLFKRTSYEYLGWTKISYVNSAGDKIDSCIVHFSATADFLKRKIDYRWPHDKLHTHEFYQTEVFTWLRGNNVYTPILNPSDWLKENVREKHNMMWDGKKWKKIIEHEGNILAFPKSG